MIFRATRSPKLKRTDDITWLDALLEESRKATSHAAQTGCRTRVATRPEQLEAAAELVRKRYASRGYQVNAVQRARAPSSAERVTLLAEDRGALVGTLTVRPDATRGLLAEMSYGAEIESLRRKGHVLGEVVKLAVDEGGNSRTALDALVRSAYVISHVVQSRSHVVIEVNPRHVRFYERALGFVVTAPERMCTRVGAPSVLMELDLAQFGRRLQSTAGKVRPALEVVS